MFKSRQKKYFLLTKRSFRSLIVIFFVFGIVFYFGKSKIEKINCQINKTPCGQEIERELREFLGQNFFLLDPKEKISQLKASYPHWQEIKIKKNPFNKISVEIKTYQPVACLKVQDKTFLTDREAQIVGEVEVNPGLPEIETEKFNQEEVKKALEAIFLAEQYSLSSQRIKIENQNELVLYLGETKVFLTTKDLPLKIASLQMITNRAKIEGKLPVKIDLRFKKPVVTY